MRVVCGGGRAATTAGVEDSAGSVAETVATVATVECRLTRHRWACRRHR